MCYSPILLPNPYKNRGLGFEHKGKKVVLSIGGKFDYLHDTTNHYICVPCGQCSQCLSIRQGFVNQRIQMESFRSELFFFTLTYANRGLKYTNIGDYHVPYPEYKDIQNLFKSLRKILPHPVRYFVVSEYGSKKHRPHFHGIIAVDRNDIVQFYRGSRLYCEKRLYELVFQHWRRNVSKSHKFPVYIFLSDFVVRGKKRTYDFHWVEPIKDHDNDLSFYITKYMLKYSKSIHKLLRKISLDSTLTESQTSELISQIKPRAVMSKDFGSWKLPAVDSYVKKCLSMSKDYPSFFDINTGKSMLLSPYYRKRFLTMDYKLDKYFQYLHQLQYLDIDDMSFAMDSFNPELVCKDFVTDWNRKAFKKILKDKHLSRVKLFVSKK